MAFIDRTEEILGAWDEEMCDTTEDHPKANKALSSFLDLMEDTPMAILMTCTSRAVAILLLTAEWDIVATLECMEDTAVHMAATDRIINLLHNITSSTITLHNNVVATTLEGALSYLAEVIILDTAAPQDTTAMTVPLAVIVVLQHTLEVWRDRPAMVKINT